MLPATKMCFNPRTKAIFRALFHLAPDWKRCCVWYRTRSCTNGQSIVEDYCLLGYDAIQFLRELPMLWRHLLSSSSSNTLVPIYHSTYCDMKDESQNIRPRKYIHC
jgi:hypothetical protein